MRKLKNPDDKPNLQIVKMREKKEKTPNENNMFLQEVSPMVEDYYPLPPSNSNSKNMPSDSIVSSTVGTPPSPQTSSELFDLLAEGLDIPGPQSNVQTSLEGTTLFVTVA